MQKPFAEGMYRFSMFMIDYYSRVRENLKLDYDSFMKKANNLLVPFVPVSLIRKKNLKIFFLYQV